MFDPEPPLHYLEIKNVYSTKSEDAQTIDNQLKIVLRIVHAKFSRHFECRVLIGSYAMCIHLWKYSNKRVLVQYWRKAMMYMYIRIIRWFYTNCINTKRLPIDFFSPKAKTIVWGLLAERGFWVVILDFWCLNTEKRSWILKSFLIFQKMVDPTSCSFEYATTFDFESLKSPCYNISFSNPKNVVVGTIKAM